MLYIFLVAFFFCALQMEQRSAFTTSRPLVAAARAAATTLRVFTVPTTTSEVEREEELLGALSSEGSNIEDLVSQSEIEGAHRI